MQELRQYQENRKSEGTELVKLLGTTTKVNKFARFYEQHKEDFDLLTAVLLDKFNSEEEYNSKENAFYRLGLYALPSIFEECLKEVQIKKEMERVKAL